MAEHNWHGKPKPLGPNPGGSIHLSFLPLAIFRGVSECYGADIAAIALRIPRLDNCDRAQWQ